MRHLLFVFFSVSGAWGSSVRASVVFAEAGVSSSYEAPTAEDKAQLSSAFAEGQDFFSSPLRLKLKKIFEGVLADILEDPARVNPWTKLDAAIFQLARGHEAQCSELSHEV